MIFQKRPHTIRETLGVAVSFLSDKEITTAQNDAFVLLQYILKLDKVKLLQSMTQDMEDKSLKSYENALRQRAEGYPLQYLVKKQEFMSLDFEVSPAVLIPRPETELLVEKVIDLAHQYPKPAKIVDVCTGSGCIIISICYYFKKGIFVAGDISHEALDLAKKNTYKNGVEEQISFIQADLLGDQAFSNSDIIVSNPPYIASEEINQLQREVRFHEPKLALDGGQDGLNIYRRLIPQAYLNLNTNGWFLVEIGCDQAQAVKELFEINGFTKVEVQKDYAGLERIVVGQKVTDY